MEPSSGLHSTSQNGQYRVARAGNQLSEAQASASDRTSGKFTTVAQAARQRSRSGAEGSHRRGGLKRDADAFGLIQAFTAAGVPAAPVRDLEGVFTSPEGEAMIVEAPDPVRGLLRLVRSPLEGIGFDPDDCTPPPTLGEHDAEIREGLAGS